MVFHDRLKKLIEENHETLASVGVACGLDKSAAYLWFKRGTLPKRETLDKLAEHFDVPVDFLLGKKETLKADILEPEQTTLFWERYEELCLINGRRPFSVGAELGYSNGSVAQWKKGSMPKYSTLKRIAGYFNVSVDYLLGKTVIKEEMPIHPYTEEELDKLGFIPYTTGHKVPIIGEISAGFDGEEAYEKVIGYRECNVAVPHNYFFLKVKGDSMLPEIKDGDFALIERMPDVPNGAIAVVIYNGEQATLKKVQKNENGIVLIPLNPQFEPRWIVGKEELKKVIICGKMIGLQRDYFNAYL